MRMPKDLVNKYFGVDKLDYKTEFGKKQAVRFLASELGVKPDEIELRDGQCFVRPKAQSKMVGAGVDDRSFLAEGGKVQDTFELAGLGHEIATLGIRTLTGSDLAQTVKAGLKSASQHGGEKLQAAADFLTSSGVTEALTTVASGATGLLGAFLLRRGVKQTIQGAVRKDGKQFTNGLRSSLLGAQSVASSASLAAQLSQHALVKAGATVAKAVAAPIAFAHGALDFAQGVSLVRKGVKGGETLTTVKGITQIGMGAGWVAVGLGGGPLVLAGCYLLMGVNAGTSILSDSQEKKERETGKAVEQKRMQENFYEAERAPTQRPIEETDLAMPAKPSELFLFDGTAVSV